MKNVKFRYFTFDEMVMVYSEKWGSIYSFFGEYEMDLEDKTASELMVSTGFKDNNGNDIYEYDYLIVNGEKYIVLFENGKFILKNKHNRFMNINKILDKQTYIVGNYFENNFEEKIEPLLDTFAKIDNKLGKLINLFKKQELPFFKE